MSTVGEVPVWISAFFLLFLPSSPLDLRYPSPDLSSLRHIPPLGLYLRDAAVLRVSTSFWVDPVVLQWFSLDVAVGFN